MNNTRLTARLLAAGALALALPASVFGHRMWILPSTTVLSGADQWITVDAAISNDLFFPNHHGMPLESIAVTAPDGSELELQNAVRGKIRSVFDVQLAQEGTYKIAQSRDLFFASWMEDGERKRWRGSRDELAEADFTSQPDFQAQRRSMRVEAFVTAGAPTTEVFESTGEGIELVPDTHPNDLYAGESARFQLLINGEPLSEAEVTVIRGDDRYRDEVGAIEASTDAEGFFTVSWPEPGRYWLEVEGEGESTDSGFDFPVGSSASYTAVLEVLPL